MLIYRITSTKYAQKLIGSGSAARWNSNGVFMIYATGSVALACLENAVHRNGADLSLGDYSLMIIEVPDGSSREVTINELTAIHKEWYRVDNEAYQRTQQIGDQWIADRETLLLKVPSSIVQYEYNYLINPNHQEFSKVKIQDVQKFVFDERIKAG
ncbi:RES domain-containing protein [Solitalea longa]|uniref:RES domain-containing protein n=1 Tax=Solitalea longa TaxID=2079460 RepID=A0A2S5A1U0_9SPHI|nr:RES family NAD+ phosphorylase [Solitalea longa]POY36568.1 RES domain-containing protein [Solitalea longa]